MIALTRWELGAIMAVLVAAAVAVSAVEERLESRPPASELSMRYDLTSAHPAGLLIHDRKTDIVYFCGKNLVTGCYPWANLRELVP